MLMASIDIECAANPLNGGRRGDIGVEGDDVEADRQTPQFAPCEQQVMRRSHDAPLLEEVDARGCAAKTAITAHSDFDNDQDVALEQDEVELAEATAVVLEQQRQSARDQEVAGSGFGRDSFLAAIYAAARDQGCAAGGGGIARPRMRGLPSRICAQSRSRRMRPSASMVSLPVMPGTKPRCPGVRLRNDGIRRYAS